MLLRKHIFASKIAEIGEVFSGHPSEVQIHTRFIKRHGSIHIFLKNCPIGEKESISSPSHLLQDAKIVGYTAKIGTRWFFVLALLWEKITCKHYRDETIQTVSTHCGIFGSCDVQRHLISLSSIGEPASRVFKKSIASIILRIF